MMNISEIKKRKEYLEKTVSNLINNFSLETKTNPESIYLDKMDVTSTGDYSPKFLYSIKIKIVL